MKVITVEEHITSEEVIQNLNQARNIGDDVNPERLAFFRERALVGGRLTDIDGERMAFMDKCGIDVQILSYINPTDGSGIPNDVKTANCKMANDYLKSICDKYPERFKAFAYLPLWDVEAACEELERTVKEYGFVGALVTGKTEGHFLDEKQFFPVFEKSAELDVPIYFHPSMPVKQIQDYYYNSPDGSWSQEVANELGSAAFGWHLDIGIQVVRMILTGVFDKLPNLKLITGHWGEGIIAMLDRIDYMIPKSMSGLNKNISEYYKENIYVTPSGIESAINLKAVTEYVGADHVIWAVDYPYLRNDTVVDFLLNSDLTEEEKELISHKNAERLFKL